MKMLDRTCGECSGPIPDSKRLGAIFCSAACKHRDFRRRKKSEVYMRLPDNHIMLSADQSRIIENQCSGCTTVTAIDGGIVSNRQVLICTSCFKVMRRRL